MAELLSKKSDISNWNNDDVITWLQMCKLDQFVPHFKRHNIEGYTLFQLKEFDLEVHMKIESLGFRKNIMRHINNLKAIWVKIYGIKNNNTEA